MIRRIGLAAALTTLLLGATLATSAAVGAPLSRLFPGATTITALTCGPASPTLVRGIRVPAHPIAGFCHEQLTNAAEIIAAAETQGIGPHTQAVGVMTAIGESNLVNLTHGDAAGPDSRGLFQQRANGAWGSLADRTDPYTAATMFFTALVAQPGWQHMSPTTAAHTVQQNADPGYYQQFWPQAKTIVQQLTGHYVPDIVASS
ncbi:hypothetical protein [Curtobacterium ammoniigenes]|uniref:hypothetical protein n=1 Tax=Curtobacterium ammoniigenes TaxID=395387 RepID=UPI000832629B|nr:hypothetical protein [Curtobacterium ammoniigenes]